jgi:hypothetical protein
MQQYINIEDFSASLLDGNLRFGKYPTQEEVILLVTNGYALFVDVTCEAEMLTPYILPNTIKLLKLPIQDRSIPNNTAQVTELVKSITRTLDIHEKVYIHCKGGHGRSALIACCVLGELRCRDTTQRSSTNTITSKDLSKQVLETCKLAHQNRRVMKPRWRKLGSPQTTTQCNFVVDYITSRQQLHETS